MTHAAPALFKHNTLAVITFSTTQASFAIPLEQVLYIEKDVKRNIQLNELDQFNHEVITFQNKTVELHDFNRLIGTESHEATMTALVTQLNEMEQQHIDWLNALEDSIKQRTPFTKATDPSKCAFGQWYARFDTNNEELKEVLTRFDQPHRQIHSLAQELLGLAHGNQNSALEILERHRSTTLAELIGLFQLAKERALSSIRPIILFVEHNVGRISALRLDNINDIVNYDRKNFSPDDSTEGLLKKRLEDFSIEGFLRNGDRAPVMLINCQPGKAGEDASENTIKVA